jgi:hypothetical protein
LTDSFSASDGFDRLYAALEHRVSDGEHLASRNVLTVLSAANERRLPFDEAWSMAINRVQPSQIDGVVDVTLARELRDDRVLLEENRPYYQAAYEGRALTLQERAQTRAAAWRRAPELTGDRPRAAKRAA